jgi:hypothetical protein
MITPYRLVSLWEMLKQYSTFFSDLMVGLFDLESSLYGLDEAEAAEALSEEDREALRLYVMKALQMGTQLELDASAICAKRMLETLKGIYPKGIAHKDIADLRSRIEDQLQSRFFKFVHPNRVSYYRDPMLFGEAVHNKFPKAIDDIELAGQCLALEQGTATVMHLMRVIEEGLKFLARRLGIPYAPSWESYLTQIQNKISEKNAKKTSKWKKLEPLYRDLSGDLITIKQAWRNPTMHIERRYLADEAEEIFKATKTFMGRLATVP